jgi:hypothetical protein
MFSLSCAKLCPSKTGKLALKNNSLNTVQKIMIDGVNYGTLDPGEDDTYDLPAGEHEFQQVGISGGTGCAPAKVIIIECETQSFKCSN